MDNAPYTSLPPSPTIKESTGNVIEVRPNSDAALSTASPSSTFANQSYTARDEPEGFDIQRLFSIVLRRWKVMLAIFLISAVLGVVTVARSKPIYQATATIELTAGQQGMQPMGDITGIQSLMTRNSGTIETHLENIRSPELTNRAIAKLSPEKRLTLSQMATIDVAQMGVTRLITVSVRSYDAQAASSLANTISQEYIAQSLETNRSNTRGTVVYVENQLASVRERLSQSQSELKKFKLETGIFNISEEASALAVKNAGLRSELEAASAQRSSTQAKLQGLQSLLARIPASKLTPTGVQRNPQVDSWQANLAQLELDRTLALREYRPNSRRVKSIDSQIQALKGQLRKEAQTIVSAWQPDPTRIPLVNDAVAAQTQLWSLDAQIRALQGQTSQARQELSKLPEQEFRFSQLSTDTQVLQQTYQLLNERLQALLIGENARMSDARLASKARPSGAPVAPNKTRVLIYTLSVGLLAALGIGLLLDLMDNHIYSEDDVHRVTGLPVLVQVPLFREEQQFNLLQASQTLNGKSSPLLETFRMLRTNIRLSAVDKPIRSLIITSSMPSEGKSHTALNLAVAAATSGDRVILVDLDLRRPSTHRICDLPNEIGFTSVVSNQTSLEAALQETAVTGLRILTSGPIPPNPFRLLNSQAARQLIEKLGTMADLVIIDTPPMLTMADALLISSWVDGTLLVISSSEMRKRDVGRSADMLFQNNNEVLGTILTKVSSNVDGYYSYYGYKNYNHYFESPEAVAFDGEKPLPESSTKNNGSNPSA